MNQKLEVKLVDMGTNSEEQCNAASFFLVANPNVQSFGSSPKPCSLQPTPVGSWREQLGIGRKVCSSQELVQAITRPAPGWQGQFSPVFFGLSLWVIVLGQRTRVHNPELGLPTPGCRNGLKGCVGTDTRKECSFAILVSRGWKVLSVTQKRDRGR